MANSKHLVRARIVRGTPALEDRVSDLEQLHDLLLAGPVEVADITATPPGSPVNGEVVVVGAGGTGYFSGHDTQLAVYLTDYAVANPTAPWQFVTPWDGMLARIAGQLPASNPVATFGWDAVRAKWLGTDLHVLTCGDNTNLGPSFYLSMDGGIQQSDTNGWQLPFDFTVVGLEAWKADSSIALGNQFRRAGNNTASTAFPAAGDHVHIKHDLNNNGAACGASDFLGGRAGLTGSLDAVGVHQRWLIRQRAV